MIEVVVARVVRPDGVVHSESFYPVPAKFESNFIAPPKDFGFTFGQFTFVRRGYDYYLGHDGRIEIGIEERA